MTVTWVKGTPTEFVNTPFKAVKAVTDGFDMDALVKKGAETMQRIIGTVNTTKSGPGRYETGLMLRTVGWRVEMGDGKIVGEFGWLDEGGRKPYFLYQEYGFTHVGSGQEIAAMMALQDADVQTREEFMQKLSEAIKRG